MQPDPHDDDPIFRRYLERPRRRRLARVVEAYYRFVWDTAFRVTGNAADAADIAQDVFLRLLLDPPRPERVRSPRGYLAWEVVGRASNLRRAAERRQARELAAASQAAGDGVPAADLEQLRGRVRELPDDLRATVELRYFAGLKNADIAALTGVGERHVEKRLERARELLRARLGSMATALVLLDRATADGSDPLGPSLEPPGELLAELHRIVRHGAALAVPSVQAGAAAGGMTLAKQGAIAIAAAALLLLGGIATSGWLSPRQDPEARLPSSPGNGEPRTTAETAAVLAPAEDAAPAVEELKPAAAYGSVRGTVWSEGGEPIAGARLTLEGAITEDEAAKLREEGFPGAQAGRVERELVTGEGGEYSFAQLYPMMVTINVDKAPYLPNWIPRGRIKAGEERKYDLILCLPLRVHGTVQTPEGEPVQGAQIFISFDYAKHFYFDPADTDPEELEHAFPVHDDGRFDTGFGIVNISHFCSLPGYVLAPGREMKGFTLRCRDFTEREARLDLVLGSERRLTMIVQDSSGAPVAGAAVCASSLAIHNVVTDAEGRASLDRLPATNHGISVEKEGYHSETLRAATLSTPEVRVVLHARGPGIEGRITFDDRLPEANREASDIDFYELDDHDRRVRRLLNVARVDEETWTFSYHPKGPLRFEALCEVGWRTLVQKPLVYDGRNKLQVDFHVRLEPPYISGRVVRAGSREPLPGRLPVTLRLPWGDRGPEIYWAQNDLVNGFWFPGLPANQARTKAAPDGSFLFLLSATDRYRSVTPLPTRAILTAGSDELGYSADLDLGLDIAASTVLEDVEREVSDFGAIEGQVVDDAGQPLPGAIVVAYDGYYVVKHSKTDAQAAYRIEGLRPGQYLLEYLGRAPYAKERFGGGGVDAEGLPRPSEFFERPVLVEAGQTSRRDIDLRTDALGAIDGVVPGELKATRAACSLIIGDRPRGGTAFGRETDVRGGRFQLERLWPGTYRVWLSGAEGGRIAETDVAVGRGPRTALVLSAPTGSLVIPLEGAPAPRLGEARILQLARRETYRSQGRPVDTPIAAAGTAIEGGRVRLDGLVSGSVHATILVPGFEAVQSEPVWVAHGRETVAPPVVLVPGCSARVRLELEDGLRLPEEPSFWVTDVSGEVEVHITATRQGDELRWALSGFPAGTFTIRVHSISGFEEVRGDVTTAPGGEAELTLRLVPRRD